MDNRHEAERINRLISLDGLISDLKKENKKLAPSKMVKLSREIPEEELFRHIDIIKLLAGSGYTMTPEHEKIITGMIYYFHGLEDEAKKYGFDLSKGIGITGTWGVGKTTLFGVFHEYLSRICPIDYNPNTFRITSTDEIIDTLRDKSESEAFKTLFLLNTIENTDGTSKPKPIHICINEFGARYDIKHYGSDVNDLFDTFLMHRYDIFVKYGKVTHMTTNYGAKDLEKIFSKGDVTNTPDIKLPDRFKEIWNMKNLKGTSFRK
jgi:hypothetical protein